MPKFFVFSDAHSYYDELMTALDEAGFDLDNPTHFLVSCGDIFDRGPGTIKMYGFICKMKKTGRFITIAGNHEDLLEDLCCRGYPCGYDSSNGTVKTVKSFKRDKDEEFGITCEYVLDTLRPYLYNLKNFFETKNYIFVHGWIPHVTNWRDATAPEWDNARWKNGMDEAELGHTIEGKTVVCGHWNSSYGHYMKKLRNNDISLEEMFTNSRDYYEFGDGADFSPYYDKGIIAIDACTPVSHKVNVIVLEDEFLEKNICSEG